MHSWIRAGLSIRPSRTSSFSKTRSPVSKTSTSGLTPRSLMPLAIARTMSGRVDHDVVATGGEVHRSGVERADFRTQFRDVLKPLGH